MARRRTARPIRRSFRRWPVGVEEALLGLGLLAAAVSGLAAYRVVGPYGDGPFGAGFRRLPDPVDASRSILVHDFDYGGETVRVVINERTRRAAELRLGGTRTRLDLAPGGVVVERDLDGDGVTDRWEYYADRREPGQGRIEKVGFSLAGDPVEDAWAYYGRDGQLTRIEVSTARDGVVDRWEHYRDSVLVLVETDTDGDGRSDERSVWVDGIRTGSAPDAAGAGREGP